MGSDDRIVGGREPEEKKEAAQEKVGREGALRGIGK